MYSLDGFWRFRKDPQSGGEKLGWRRGFTSDTELAVPGSWNEQLSELEPYFGVGWYCRAFELPLAWEGAFASLHIGCAQHSARVWVNGCLVGEHAGASLPFELPLDGLLRAGQANMVVIRVDGSLDAWGLPAARIDPLANEGFHNSNPAVTYDFFPYCGLPRSVCLQLTPTRSRIDALQADYSVDLPSRTVALSVLVTLRGAALKSARVQVRIENSVCEGVLEEDGRLRARIRIPNARLWHLGRPELYQIDVSLEEAGRMVDRYVLTTGFRRIEVSGERLLLNGEPVVLRGFGKHEDFAVAGRGIFPPLVVRDFDLLRWIGANSFRTSHYPYDEDWYEFADRRGVLLVGETPLVGLCQRLFDSPDVYARARDLVRDMIERDRHHPSVVVWSVANEPWIDSPLGELFIKGLIQEARACDASRPITYAAHMEPVNNAPAALCDLVFINKYYGWYELPGEIEQGSLRLGDCLDRYHRAFKKPVVLAEFGADAIPGQHSEPPTMFTEEYQAQIIEAQYREALKRPWVVGVHVWAFADFKTPQSITRAVRNHKGVFTRDRMPKLAAHALRRLWSGACSAPSTTAALGLQAQAKSSSLP